MRALLAIILLTFFLLACAPEQQLPPARPELPDNNRVVVIDDGPVRPTIEDNEEKNSAKADLDALLKEEPPEEFTIVWDTTSTINGTRIEEKSTDYVSREKGTKFVVKTTVNDEVSEFENYFLPDGYYQCVKDIGWECISFPDVEEPTEELVPEDVPEDTSVITELAGKKVAGQDTRCFQIVFDEVTQVACYAQSVLLYLKISGPNVNVVRKAESFRKIVPDDIYDLPATPRTARLNEGGWFE
ncbi:hypothetical protein GOV10_02040, partial [Candidatus Woesearchaeota archaeon]|nr:hypothetical protein [Candidatus Woesearchaeota archaeon]